MFKNLEWEGTFRKPMKAQRHKGVKWGSHGLKELMLPASQRRFTTGERTRNEGGTEINIQEEKPFFSLT